MTEQLGLFDMPAPRLKYPDAPGAKTGGTSRDAANAIEPAIERLRRDVLKALTLRPMTADECAAYLGLDVLTVRPRFSELHKATPPKVIDSGERRPSSRGNPSVVWEAAL